MTNQANDQPLGFTAVLRDGLSAFGEHLIHDPIWRWLLAVVVLVVATDYARTHTSGNRRRVIAVTAALGILALLFVATRA